MQALVFDFLAFAKQKLRVSFGFWPPAGSITSDEYCGQ